jgi:hypothetical protein
MEQSLRIPPKGRKRIGDKKTKKEAPLKITRATYIAGLKVLVSFSDNISKIIDFKPIFNKYVKGDFLAFAEKKRFKNFVLKNGNISWGENEDIVFPVNWLYENTHARISKDEILYIL